MGIFLQNYAKPISVTITTVIIRNTIKYDFERSE